jgi:hypothetical protein
MNYRSVVVLGVARLVEDPDEHAHALDVVVDHVIPGRTAEVRASNAKELRGTAVLALGLHESSAKVRTGGPVDEPDDLAVPGWGGVVPVRIVAGAPVADEHTPDAVPVPPSLRSWQRPGSRPVAP